MALRDLAGGAARISAGFWNEVARVVAPPPEREAAAEAASTTDRPAAPPGEAAAPVVTEGAMLVPIDTWTRVLDQLGNLHQAGQELAEARERAARAETEAAFLREQLATLRATRAPRSGTGQRRRPASTAAPVNPLPGASGPRASVARARNRVRGWLAP